jgi:hypothetical protein
MLRYVAKYDPGNSIYKVRNIMKNAALTDDVVMFDNCNKINPYWLDKNIETLCFYNSPRILSHIANDPKNTNIYLEEFKDIKTSVEEINRKGTSEGYSIYFVMYVIYNDLITSSKLKLCPYVLILDLRLSILRNDNFDVYSPKINKCLENQMYDELLNLFHDFDCLTLFNKTSNFFDVVANWIRPHDWQIIQCCIKQNISKLSIYEKLKVHWKNAVLE